MLTHGLDQVDNGARQIFAEQVQGVPDVRDEIVGVEADVVAAHAAAEVVMTDQYSHHLNKKRNN